MFADYYGPFSKIKLQFKLMKCLQLTKCYLRSGAYWWKVMTKSYVKKKKLFKLQTLHVNAGKQRNFNEDFPISYFAKNEKSNCKN